MIYFLVGIFWFNSQIIFWIFLYLSNACFKSTKHRKSGVSNSISFSTNWRLPRTCFAWKVDVLQKKLFAFKFFQIEQWCWFSNHLVPSLICNKFLVGFCFLYIWSTHWRYRRFRVYFSFRCDYSFLYFFLADFELINLFIDCMTKTWLLSNSGASSTFLKCVVHIKTIIFLICCSSFIVFFFFEKASNILPFVLRINRFHIFR